MPRLGLPAIHVSKVVQKLRMKYETLDGEDALRNSGCGTGRRLKVVWIAQMMKLDDKEGCTGDREGGRSCYPYNKEWNIM